MSIVLDYTYKIYKQYKTIELALYFENKSNFVNELLNLTIFSLESFGRLLVINCVYVGVVEYCTCMYVAGMYVITVYLCVYNIQNVVRYVCSVYV